MMTTLLTDLENDLAALDAQSLRRSRRVINAPCCVDIEIDGHKLINFASNDYLGLANHPHLIEAARQAAARWGVGSGSSHLICGHLAPHEQLENRLAAFSGRERALTFSTGFMANLAVTPTLIGREDTVFQDELNHASLIDAGRISRANRLRYPHGDVDTLARQLEQTKHGKKLILTDAVFSMDGDLAPLAEIYTLAERYDAWLVVDDAHGFGILGPQGRGSLAMFALPDSPRIVMMGTLGKAAGVAGAFVAGDARVIEWLIQKARTYIFTTASSPIIAAALLASIDLIAGADGDKLRANLHKLIQTLRNELAPLCERHGWQLLPSSTPIQPLVIGANEAALNIAATLYEQGVFIPAIRPPTVPADSARLRITLSAAMSDSHLEKLIAALKRI